MADDGPGVPGELLDGGDRRLLLMLAAVHGPLLEEGRRGRVLAALAPGLGGDEAGALLLRLSAVAVPPLPEPAGLPKLARQLGAILDGFVPPPAYPPPGIRVDAAPPNAGAPS